MPCIIIGGDTSVRLAHARAQVPDVLSPDHHILTQDIGILHIRTLVSSLSLHPYGNKRLVYLEGSALTIPAQHALLKYLEEIPNHTHLFIGSSSANTLLDTIRSRCTILTVTAQKPSQPVPIHGYTDYPSLMRAQREAIKVACTHKDRDKLVVALGRLRRACRASKFSLVSMPYTLIEDYVLGVVE